MSIKLVSLVDFLSYLQKVAAQHRRRFAMGRQNITLVGLDCRCERPGNLRNAGVRFKEFQHGG